MSERSSTGRAEVIFVVGTAYSGKTEIASAFRARRDTMVVRRAYFWRDAKARYGALQDDHDLSRTLARLANDEFLRSAGVDLHVLGGLAESAATHGRLFLAATREAARRKSGLKEGPRRLVVQIGGLERSVAGLSSDLPEARFVHTIRDPRRYLGSADRPPTVGRLGWRLALWSSSATAASRNARELPDRYLVVRGEDMIETPVRVSSELSDHVGIEVSLSGAADSLAEKGHSLSRRSAGIVERLVGNQLVSLGYSLEGAREPSARAALALDAGLFHLRTRFAFRSGAAS